LIACCLGVFVWLALLIAIAVGWIAIGLWAGQRLLAALKVRDASVLVEVALGVFLITVLGRLPCCLGALFSAVVGSIGLGAVVLTRFGRQPLVAAGQGPTRPAQSLEELDAEVLAPLALPVVGPASVAFEPAADENVGPDVSDELLAAPPVLEPAVEPAAEAPLLEGPEDPAGALTPGQGEDEVRPDMADGGPPVQPAA
jgi:hypothetical protein